MKKSILIALAFIFLFSCSKNEEPVLFADISEVTEEVVVDLISLQFLAEYGGIELPIGLLLDHTKHNIDSCDIESILDVSYDEPLFIGEAPLNFETTCRRDPTFDQILKRHRLIADFPLQILDETYPLDVYHNAIDISVSGDYTESDYCSLGSIDRTSNFNLDFPEDYSMFTTCGFQFTSCSYDYINKSFIEGTRVYFYFRLSINGNSDKFITGSAEYDGYIEYRANTNIVVFEESKNEYLIE